MTGQISKPKDLDRNRENQRRSRQRRLDYIQSLEAQIQRYEAAGVQASKEIQDAAKLVVQENVLLRDLLYSLGQTEGNIKAYLKATPLEPNQAGDTKDSGTTPNKDSGPGSNSSTAAPNSANCPHRNGNEQAPKTTETACEEAARIIAGMRGVPETRDILSELGCKETKNCNISNTKIFQLMDR